MSVSMVKIGGSYYPMNVVADVEMRPVGEITLWPGATLPNGWMLCDGSAISRTGFPELFNAIGTTYGAGDGSTTFNLPNLKGRVPVGAGLASATGATNHPLGQASGEEAHTLSISEMPAHNHAWQGVNDGAAITGSAGTYPFRIYQDRLGNWDGSRGYIANEGGSQPHNNMQPYLTLNFMIRYTSRIAYPGGASPVHTHTQPGISARHTWESASVNGQNAQPAMDAVVEDTNGFKTNNFRFTIPTGMAGLYHLTYNQTWYYNPNGWRMAAIMRNGSQVLTNINPSAHLNYVTVSGLLRLSAGDYIEWASYQNCGDYLTQVANQTNFMMYRVGV